MIKPALMVIGAVFLLAGLLFAAQGSGVFPYPAASQMIDQSVWIYRGAGLALAGVILILFSFKFR